MCLTAGSDLAVNAVVPVTGVWDEVVHIYVRNNTCDPVSPTVTLHYSTKYDGSPSFFIWPSAIAPGTAAWNLSPMNSATGITDFFFMGWALTPLTPGDTVHEYVVVTPTDMDTTNNVVIRTDTVRAGCDPNFIAVSPAACFDAVDTQFEYTIHFENTGNDTAHNIHVLDTLSEYLDLSSFRMVMASAEMETFVSKENGLNVIKFDFPRINLLDSSHHGLCDGVVIFTIKPKAGLPDGTVIPHRSGIYFDINPVVMTNTVYDVKGCPVVKVLDVAKGDVAIYPNPAKDELEIKTEQDAYTSFTITSSIGQVLMQQPLSGSQTKVNVKMLPAGLYYITMKGDNGSVVKKFVKM